MLTRKKEDGTDRKEMYFTRLEDIFGSRIFPSETTENGEEGFQFIACYSQSESKEKIEVVKFVKLSRKSFKYQSELIFEHMVEDREDMKEVIAKANEYLRDELILCDTLNTVDISYDDDENKWTEGVCNFCEIDGRIVGFKAKEIKGIEIPNIEEYDCDGFLTEFKKRNREIDFNVMIGRL